MSEVLIQISKLCKSYGKHKVLKNINISFPTKGLVALIGANGAGKSTLLRIISGEENPTSGSVEFKSCEINDINFCNEEGVLIEDVKLEDLFNFYMKLNKSNQKLLNKLIEYFELEHYLEKKVSNLSKGNKQKVGLVQAFLDNSKFVFLDEPFVNLDPQSIKKLRDFLVSKKNDQCILISSHQLKEIEAICDDFIIIDHGEIKFSNLSSNEPVLDLEKKYLEVIN